MMRSKKGQFIKTRFDRFCIDCDKPLSGYKSTRCKSCASKCKNHYTPRHNKPHTDATRVKISLSKGGTGIKKPKRERGWKYKQWRDKVFRRDKWTCLGCGQTGGQLEAHHLKGWTEYPELRFKVSNGQTLCIDCHKKTNNYKNYEKKFYGNQFKTGCK